MQWSFIVHEEIEVSEAQTHDKLGNLNTGQSTFKPLGDGYPKRLKREVEILDIIEMKFVSIDFEEIQPRAFPKGGLNLPSRYVLPRSIWRLEEPWEIRISAQSTR